MKKLRKRRLIQIEIGEKTMKKKIAVKKTRKKSYQLITKQRDTWIVLR